MEEVDNSENSENVPLSNIREYIVNSRKAGYPDSMIIDRLEKTNWPKDVIDMAVKEADKIIPAQSEEQPEQALQAKDVQGKTKGSEEKPQEQKKQVVKTEETGKVAQEDLFTKPPKEVLGEKEQNQPQAEKKFRRKFSILSLIALLFSPIPFIGLGIAMWALDDVRKNKKSGVFFALLALTLNIAVILFIIWVIFQVLTLDPERLTGFAKNVNDILNLVE